MNRIEQSVYSLVKRHPNVKFALRNVYQGIFDCLPAPKANFSYPVSVREGYFYGFHDHTPFSHEGSMLLGMKYDSEIPLRMPEREDVLEIGYFDGPELDKWHPVSETKAWNWHQGCKLFWRGKADQIVFNDRRDGRALARVVERDGREIRVLPRALGSVSPDGRFGVGYDFDRVEHCMPGYGYQHLTPRPGVRTLCPDDEGMYRIDIESGKSEMIFSIADVARLISDEPTMDGAHHYFSHTIFSPSGKRFVFLHRWIRGNVRKRWCRLVTSDLEGKDIRVFRHREMASHIAWRDDSQLLAYSRAEDGRDGYVLYDDRDPEKWEMIGRGAFNSDGHPSFMSKKRYFATDTYPDRRRVQTLNVFDMESKIRYEIGRMPTSRRFASGDPQRHWCCDLHPRMDRGGRYICFDATFTGKRALVTLDFGKPFWELDAVKSIREYPSE